MDLRKYKVWPKLKKIYIALLFVIFIVVVLLMENINSLTTYSVSYKKTMKPSKVRSKLQSEFESVFVPSLNVTIRVPPALSESFISMKQYSNQNAKFWTQQERILSHNYLLTGSSLVEPHYMFHTMTRERMEQAFAFLRSHASLPEEESYLARSQYAYCVFVNYYPDKKNYIDGLFALIKGWRTVKSQYPLIVLSQTRFPSLLKESLEKMGATVIYSDIKVYDSDGSFNWQVAYNKLIAWTLPHFKKLVLLDSDVVILKNVDEMLSFPELSAAYNIEGECYWNSANAGVLVMEPNEEVFKKMMEYSKGKSCLSGNFRWYDQELLICLYSGNYPEKFGTMYQLPYAYGGRPGICGCRANTIDPKLHQEKYWQVYDDVNPEDFYLVHFYSTDAKAWDLSQTELEINASNQCSSILYLQYFRDRDSAFEYLGFHSREKFYEAVEANE